MSKYKYNTIYEDAKNNSIGKDKVTSSNKIIKKGIVKKTHQELLAILATSSIVASFNKNKHTHISEYTRASQRTIKKDYNGYKEYEISIYEKQRAKKILEEAGLTDYIIEDSKRNYNYTAEDYQKIKVLDESYLYALHLITTEETFNTILSSLGYTSLESYLFSKGYTSEIGVPDKKKWSNADLENISLIMKNTQIKVGEVNE